MNAPSTRELDFSMTISEAITYKSCSLSSTFVLFCSVRFSLHLLRFVEVNSALKERRTCVPSKPEQKNRNSCAHEMGYDYGYGMVIWSFHRETSRCHYGGGKQDDK